MRRVWRAGLWLLLVVGCGGTLSLTEYSETVEGLIADMNDSVGPLVASYEAMPQSVDRAQALLRGTVAARSEFLDRYQDLEPPDQIRELHAIGVEVISEMRAAEEKLAARAGELETAADLGALWLSAEYTAAIAANQRASNLCEQLQRETDATADRGPFVGLPWLPPELKEIVISMMNIITVTWFILFFSVFNNNSSCNFGMLSVVRSPLSG